MSLDKLMGEFAAGLGVDPIPCDEGGVYRFAVDGTTVSFTEGGGYVHFIAAAGLLPEVGREALCRELLEAMFPGEGAEENVLTVETERDLVCLYRREPVEGLELPLFLEAFRSFGESLVKWRDRLVDYSPADGGKTDGFVQV